MAEAILCLHIEWKEIFMEKVDGVEVVLEKCSACIGIRIKRLAGSEG